MIFMLPVLGGSGRVSFCVFRVCCRVSVADVDSCIFGFAFVLPS